jgi:glucose/mannose transport system substrate-binding protein
MKTRIFATVLAASVAMSFGAAHATDLEVTHWWTSGGEAAAVKELAKAFDATGNHWVDGAIAGGGDTARPIMISRITGGDPMGAFQFNTGRQADELIEAGLLQDVTAVAEKNHWKDIINPPSLLASCTKDGKVYCIPINIHSWQWMWLNNGVFAKIGKPVPKNWDEFVADVPDIQKAGIIPLAVGGQSWQATGAFGVLQVALGGEDLWKKINVDKNADAARSPEMLKVFKAAAQAREWSKDSKVQDWNQATNLVITGKAAAQIMGDWAQGEFQVAGQKAGKDYTCLPGLGVNEILDTGGDSFYFPKQKDPAKTAAQMVLAETLLSKETQVAFNLKKGSLPVRGDVDLGAANDCMKEGLKILAAGKILPSGTQVLSPDTQGQLQDLIVNFWQNTAVTPEEAQKKYADIIAAAD